MRPPCYRGGMAMIDLYFVAALALSACGLPIPSGGTDGGISCPGLQCSCPCEAPLVCGPSGACTWPCTSDDECGHILGAACLGGICGVSCEPGGPNDCEAVGLRGAACVLIQDTPVCGYPAVEAGADTTAGTE